MKQFMEKFCKKKIRLSLDLPEEIVCSFQPGNQVHLTLQLDDFLEFDDQGQVIPISGRVNKAHITHSTAAKNDKIKNPSFFRKYRNAKYMNLFRSKLKGKPMNLCLEELHNQDQELKKYQEKIIQEMEKDSKSKYCKDQLMEMEHAIMGDSMQDLGRKILNIKETSVWANDFSWKGRIYKFKKNRVNKNEIY